MIFKDLKIGDTFTLEEAEGEVRYIKTEYVIAEFVENGDDKILKYGNAVCIDEYSPSRGKLNFVPCSRLVSHVNYS